MASLSFGHYQVYNQRQEQRLYLSQAQRLGFEQLLLLEQKLRDPECPDAVKGLDGMLTAHKILQEREASGILIGGLAEAIWNRRRKVEELYKHKDVDVAVLDDSFELNEKFEGGVDWWMPQSGRVTLNSGFSTEKIWHQNGNGVTLSFGVHKRTPLNPGLYILDSEWVIDMREQEAYVNIDDSEDEIEYDEDVFEKFRTKMREKVKTRLPRFMIEAFQGYVLSPHYEEDYMKRNAVELERFDLETIRAICESWRQPLISEELE